MYPADSASTAAAILSAAARGPAGRAVDSISSQKRGDGATLRREWNVAIAWIEDKPERGLDRQQHEGDENRAERDSQSVARAVPTGTGRRQKSDAYRPAAQAAAQKTGAAIAMTAKASERSQVPAV